MSSVIAPWRLGACLFALLAFAPAALGQAADVEVLPAPPAVCTLPADHVEMSRTSPLAERLRAAYDPAVRPSATFQVTYTGFTAPARAAFQRAVDIWAQHVESSVPIKVRASFEPLGSNVLGSAGATLVFRGTWSGFLPNTFYAAPLADALAGFDLCTVVACGSEQDDIVARFSSNQPGWYYGTDGNTPAGQYDFVTVVLHELAHGLGFFGSMTVSGGQGSWGFAGVPGVPAIYDTFAEDLGGAKLIDAYGNPSASLGAALQSNNVFFDAPWVAANLGGRGRLYAPSPWSQGSSYAHWNEGTFPFETENALLTPMLAPGETIHSPGFAVCALFDDLGWTLGDACEDLLPTASEPPAEGPEGDLVLGAPSPNPFDARAVVRLRVAAPQPVEVALFDLLGRRVALLHDGPVPAGEPLTLSVEGAGLPPGVYVLRAEGAHAVATHRLVRVR